MTFILGKSNIRTLNLQVDGRRRPESAGTPTNPRMLAGHRGLSVHNPPRAATGRGSSAMRAGGLGHDAGFGRFVRVSRRLRYREAALGDEAGEKPRAGGKRSECAPLDDAAVIEHQDLVGVGDRR